MRKYVLIVLLAITGCGGSLKSADFIEVVEDHKVITMETCEALILSIDESIAVLDPIADAVELERLQDLKERLNYMSDSSLIIDTCVEAAFLDEELLAELIRNKWHNRGGG